MLRATAPPALSRVQVGELAIDRVARVVTVRGRAVRLAAKEFERLSALASGASARVHE